MWKSLKKFTSMGKYSFTSAVLEWHELIEDGSRQNDMSIGGSTCTQPWLNWATQNSKLKTSVQMYRVSITVKSKDVYYYRRLYHDIALVPGDRNSQEVVNKGNDYCALLLTPLFDRQSMREKGKGWMHCMLFCAKRCTIKRHMVLYVGNPVGVLYNVIFKGILLHTE